MVKNKQHTLFKELISRLLSIELELETLNQDLQAIDEDLFYLNAIKNELIFNINYLRGNNIIVLMREYCRSIVQLKEIKDKTINAQNSLNQMKEKVEIKDKERNLYIKKLGLRLYSIGGSEVIQLSKKNSNIISFKRKKQEYDKKRKNQNGIKSQN